MTRPFELFDTISRDLTELERVENEKKQSTCEETAQRMNYLERARREEERPYILKRHQDFVEESFRTYEQNVEVRNIFETMEHRDYRLKLRFARAHSCIDVYVSVYLSDFVVFLLHHLFKDGT